jgi:hypothetical protein
MLLRRVVPTALATAAICACEPGVGYDAARNPQQTNYAVFDPGALPPQIPIPNDLAIAQAGSVPGAQGELLRLFVAQGNAFPNDQEVPISIDLVKIVVDASGTQVRSKPDLDLSSIRICTGPGQNCNLVVMRIPPSTPLFFTDIDQPAATDYVSNGDHGTLNIRRKPPTNSTSRVWDPGVRYVAAIRGGPNGITVNGGQPIYPQPAMYIIEQGKKLTDPENQGLIPGNTAAQKAATAAQLEVLRTTYESGPFPLVSAAFPKTDIAAITTFRIAAVTTSTPAAHVVIDSGSGTAPLPFNALLDGSTLPDDPLAPAPNARVQNLPSSFGPLAPGLATLDGFSTTAFLLVPTSAPVVVATGPDPAPTTTFRNNVFLYDLTDPNNPMLVDPSTYDDLLPGPLSPISVRQLAATDTWVSTVVGVQPAAASKLTTSKPLKEATEYAFVVTNRIKGLDGKGLGRPTVGSVLLFDNPLWAGGKSQLAGISDAQAKALERMRVQISKVLSKLATLPPGQTTAKADIAVAYTFRTQSITTPALQLAAAPYDPARNPGVNFLSTPAQLAPVVLTPAQAFTKYGVEAFVVGFSNIQEVIEANLPTPNLLSSATGAFDPALLAPGASPPIDVIPALIVVPKITASLPPACPAPNGALRCAPLVIFHHGLNGGRSQMLLGADELAGKGFVVAAIDAPKHGDRASCSTDPSAGSGAPGALPPQCATGTCQTSAPVGTQGDTHPAGLCKLADGSAGTLARRPTLCATTGCATGTTNGIPLASANYLISGNLFRFRDTLRQDVIDNSGLILALARPPTLGATTMPNPVAAELQAKGIAVNPAAVFWEGQSLGGILGTINVAANPRISEAVLNVPGGTFVDIASTSPAFASGVNRILAGLTPPILPNTPQYLQFLQVAKWVLDPAEPINFAGRMIGGTDHPTLPDLLALGAPPQKNKKVLGQLAVCDNTVPNPFNLLLFNVAGVAPPPTATTFQNNGFTTFRNTGTPDPSGVCNALPAPWDTGAVAHGFLLDHGLRPPPAASDANSTTLSLFARGDAAAFLADPSAAQQALRQCTATACQ